MAGVKSPKNAGLRLGIEQLEDRLTPATQLLSVDSGNAAALPQGAELIGTSTDGRYVIFQSTATNVVRNQVDTIPNSTDVFWQDTFTGERFLVSAERGSGGLRAGGVVPSNPGQTANAVISGDGQSVAFVSKRNANAYYSTNPSTTTVTVQDNGDTSPDVFFWNASVARTNNPTRTDSVALISQEIFGINDPTTNINVTAIGNTSSATNPAISADGQYVSFVSERNADAVDPFLAINDNGNNTPDIFRAQVDVTGGNFSFISTRPRLIDFYNTVIFIPGTGTGAGTFRVVRNAYGLNAGFLSVDPLGRYMSQDGQSFAFISNLSPSKIDTTAPVNRAGSQEVYLLNTQAAFVVDDQNATTFSEPLASLMTSAPGVANQSVGAVALNAFIPRQNPNSVVFSASVPGGANVLVPNYQNQNGGQADLYFRSATGSGSGVLNGNRFGSVSAAVLVSADASNSSAGGNGQLSTNPGDLSVSDDGNQVAFTSTSTNFVAGLSDTNGVNDVFVNDLPTGTTRAVSVTGSGAATGNGASFGPQISTDGVVVAFVSSATNLVSIADTNNATDVFVRDMSRGQTGAASVAPGGTRTGNGKSFAAVLGGSRTGGGLGFTSQATDLVQGFTTPSGVNQAYAATYPLAIPAVGSVVAVAGGVSGQAALATFNADGSLAYRFTVTPFPGFAGAVRSATADVTGDGVPDLIVGAGPGGGPQVKVYDGLTGLQVAAFFPFEPTFTGGVYVAGGDFNGDGVAEVVVGAGENGGPRVKIFDGATRTIYADLFVYEATFRGGVRVATGDVNGDGAVDLVTAAGEGGGPRITVFSGAALPGLSPLLDFFAYEPTLRNGAFVGTGDVTGDGKADIVTGAGPGGAARVIVFDAGTLLGGALGADPRLADFFAFPGAARDGVRVALRNVNGNQSGGIVAGIGGGGPQVSTFALSTLAAPLVPQQLSTQFAFDEANGLFGAWVG